MYKKLPPVVLGVIVFLLTANVVSASTTSNYFDWSSTLEAKQSKVLGITAFAQEASSSANVDDFRQFDRYVFGANLTPGNPFYFFKPFQEAIVLTFTFDQKQKQELRIAQAGERLDEMNRLVSANNTNAIAGAADSYELAWSVADLEMNKLKQQNQNIDDLVKEVETETAKHNVVLEEVSVRVPDQAKDDIQAALAAAWKSTDSAADLAGRVAVPPDVVDRLKALKAQGLLSEEEVNKIIGVKTRTEAREELKKFVKEGVVPDSDFARLNENVKALFPEEFFKIHETKRFFELERLEQEKPDDATLAKIRDFSKTYKPGDTVPSGLRRYWVPVVRLEELQNTLRPDLIDASLFKNDQEGSKKFQELVERFKPRPEDITFISVYIQKNNADVNNLPPEYQRMYNLAQQYGAQCGMGMKWVQRESGGTPTGPAGYCVPEGQNISDFPKMEDYAKGKTCAGAVVNAKSSGGACSAYPSDCIPSGWSKVDTCIGTPGYQGGQGSDTGKRIDCPSNAHFVPVSYDPNGGYCIPNYTRVGFDSDTGITDTACPAGYYRGYPGGPCIQDYGTGPRMPLPPITPTPGGPYYPGGGQCSQGSHWVPEPINPRGGYCASDNYNPNPYSSPAPQPSMSPRPDMGNCRTPGECYDYCKTNPQSPSCTGFNPSQPRPGDTASPSREAQEAACRAGGGTCVSWVNGACGCTRGGNNGSDDRYTNPSREAQEAACRAGGGTCTGWYNGACSCINKNNPTPFQPPSTSNSGSNGSYTPPPGYGNCTPPSYWDSGRSACITPTSQPSTYTGSQTSGKTPEQMCRETPNCSWTGSSCNCGSQPASPPAAGPTSAPEPAQTQPQSEPAQTQSQPAPAETQSQPATQPAPAQETPPSGTTSAPPPTTSQ